MSTSPETGELPPDPVDIVTHLQQSVDELVAAADKLRAAPSDEDIQSVFERGMDVKRAATPILADRFFHASGNDLLVGVGVDSIVNSGNNLFEKSRAILGEGVELHRFSDGVNETVSNSFITKDMSAFGTVDSEGDDEPSEEEVFEVMSEAVIEQMDTHFCAIVDQYLDAVIGDETVARYVEQRQQEMEMLAQAAVRRAEKIRQFKMVGGFLTASIVGGIVANFINGRR